MYKAPQRPGWMKKLGKKRAKENLRQQLEKFEKIYFFSFLDIRRPTMEKIARTPEWADSKIYITKQMYRSTLQNLKPMNEKKLKSVLKGLTGILLTNRNEDSVVNWFNEFAFWDYPHPGFVVDITITLPKGPLTQFQPVIEPHLRSLGMPTTVENDVVMLTEDFVVCKAATQLSSKQIYFLELLGEKLAVCQLQLKAKWTKKTGLIPFKGKNGLDEYEIEEEESESEWEEY